MACESFKAQPTWLQLLTTLGLLPLLHFSLRLLRWTYVTFLRPGKNLKTNYGSWALVTGATGDIGKSFSFQLARNGLNLILVGRDPTKLKTLSSSIQSKHPSIRIETAVVDFTGDDVAKAVDNMKEKIKGLDVGVLVNNAGVSYPYARYFHEVDNELITNLIKVNVEGLTRVTHAVIQGMIERKRGAVVNIGSGVTVVIPSDPLYAVYAATKAYIDQFSRCLYVEYGKKGIDVQCQVPLCVATMKMSSIRRSSLMVPSPDTYARAAVRCIGYEPRCMPYWPHSLLWCLLSVVPESVIDNRRLSSCLGIRKRGQLKESKKKEI